MHFVHFRISGIPKRSPVQLEDKRKRRIVRLVTLEPRDVLVPGNLVIRQHFAVYAFAVPPSKHHAQIASPHRPETIPMNLSHRSIPQNQFSSARALSPNHASDLECLRIHTAGGRAAPAGKRLHSLIRTRMRIRSHFAFIQAEGFHLLCKRL